MKSIEAYDSDRMERALEGRLSAAEYAAFQADVVRRPELREAFAERVWVQALLRAEAERLPQLFADQPVAAAVVTPRWPLWLTGSIAAAACAVLAFTSLRPSRVPPTHVIPVAATLVQASNTTWAGSTLPTVENAPLGPGILALVEGIAAIRFSSGAVVTIEAPTKLEILGAMNCRLIEGSLTAEVPVSAHGFTIDTADLRVVDLGTRFGLTAGSAGNSHVYVFEGEVSLTDPTGQELRRLTAGKTFRVASGPATASLEPRRFEPDAPIDGWKEITTQAGRGKDAYVRRDSPASAGGEPFIMVKHSELELSRKNERRGFLTFDLAGMDPRVATEVQLVLDPEPSGLGFAAMVPDSRFAVYGVTDESLDNWDEGGLVWSAAMSPLSEEWPPGARVRKLAEFQIPRGGSGSPLTVQSAAIAEFLRADTNGLATFILVRETGESDPSGLVHAFASKEHPSARPPTLRVR